MDEVLGKALVCQEPEKVFCRMELAYRWITLANRHYYLYLNRALAQFGLNSSQYLFIIYL